MSQAKIGDTVKVHYTGKLQDDEVFDSSVERDPLQVTLGQKQVIPGFEAGLMDMAVGDQKTVTIEPNDGYGPRREELVANVEKSQFPSDLELSIGQKLQVPQPEGQPVVVTVTEISEETVTLDANHPLAGKTLVFELELVEIA